jgi:hypothetical protein
MSALVQNVGYTLRQFRKNLAFAALAIITLALGIGANTAIFTVIESVLLRPLPFPKAHRVMAITAGAQSQGDDTTSWPDYTDLRNQFRLLEGVTGYFEDRETKTEGIHATLSSSRAGYRARPCRVPAHFEHGSPGALPLAVALARPRAYV